MTKLLQLLIRFREKSIPINPVNYNHLVQLLVKYEVVQWVSYFLNEMDYLGYDLGRDILE